MRLPQSTRSFHAKQSFSISQRCEHALTPYVSRNQSIYRKGENRQQTSCLPLEGLEQVQALLLDLVAVGRRAASSEVLGGVGVALERPQRPVEDRLSEAPAVGVAQCAAVADGDVALPDGHAGGHGLVVALGLETLSAFLYR